LDFDFIVVGSGFGGSVSALRLAEKGYRVAVLEQGRRVTPGDMQKAQKSVRHLLWAPALGLKGYFFERVFKDVGVVGGVGVGGGSLVFASVLLKPGLDFFQDPSWCHLGVEWSSELAPHYQTAARMLGVTENPYSDVMDGYLQKTAVAMGKGSTFGPVPNGIYFGKPGITEADPYFKGEGPERTGCDLCGACLTGCHNGAKNSLDKNYLYLAQKKGVAVFPNRRVLAIEPLEEEGYLVQWRDTDKGGRKNENMRAGKLVLSAGVLGTLELLFRCRDQIATLPAISGQLGKVVRTNSEAITCILSKNADEDLTRGTAISSHFYPDDHTHITQNRFPEGYEFMKWQVGPLTDDLNPLRRSLKTALSFCVHPFKSTLSWRARDWYKRVSVLTVMQALDNRITFSYGRSPFTLFRKGLKSGKVKGKSAPAYLPVANRAARTFGAETGGVPMNVLMESIFNLSSTAHILGGCHMGSSPENGVIDHRHRVLGYPGIYVIDGSAVSANVGVNPSLTISALAERAVELIPAKQ
jgi:cholesterol oxidase